VRTVRKTIALLSLLIVVLALLPGSGFAQEPQPEETAPTGDECDIVTDTEEYPCDYEGPIGPPPPGNQGTGNASPSQGGVQAMVPGGGCVASGDKPYKTQGNIKGHGEMECPNSHYRVAIHFVIMRERWYGWQSLGDFKWVQNSNYYRVGGTTSTTCRSGTWTYVVYVEAYIIHTSSDNWQFVDRNNPETAPRFRTTC
jgi:hypothetical protein